MRRGAAGLLLVAGCVGPSDPDPLLDTGWFTEPIDPACEDVVLSAFPAAGAADWYWRSGPGVVVATDARHAYEATLLDAAGDPVPTTPRWSARQLTLELGPGTTAKFNLLRGLTMLSLALRPSPAPPPCISLL